MPLNWIISFLCETNGAMRWPSKEFACCAAKRNQTKINGSCVPKTSFCYADSNALVGYNQGTDWPFPLICNTMCVHTVHYAALFVSSVEQCLQTSPTRMAFHFRAIPFSPLRKWSRCHCGQFERHLSKRFALFVYHVIRFPTAKWT